MYSNFPDSLLVRVHLSFGFGDGGFKSKGGHSIRPDSMVLDVGLRRNDSDVNVTDK